eukprot:c15079_g2_i1 orf=398-2188(+)
MKSPFKKLRDFAVSKHNKVNETSSLSPEEESEDVTQGMQEVEDMRSHYEGLLANAHTISGAAYDFSRSVQEMASFMMENFGQFVDVEIGNIFSMLAKVQFEISKLLDLFAAHVSQTITTPIDMMMIELQQVQTMKEQYDEKRQVFNLAQKEMQKGKPKSGKADNISQLALAKEEFKEQAQVLSFRLQSLKQGQSRSLITQAARYHSAQMHLFSKGLASITAMEPVMRQLALEKNIDRSLSEEDIDNSVSFDAVHGEGDASKHGAESESLTSSSTTLLEPQIDAADKLDVDMIPKRMDTSSKSAPISSSMYYQKETPSRAQEMPLETLGHNRKVSMYALPSPLNARGVLASQTKGHEVESSMPNLVDVNTAHDVKRPLFLGKPIDESTSQSSQMFRAHGMQTEQSTRHQKKDDRLMTFNELTNDGNLNKTPKIGRSYSHSGPISNRRLPANKRQSINNSAFYNEQIDPLYKSGPVSRSPLPACTSHSSQSVSPPLLSPPQISELHKLPLPPSPQSAILIANSSAPLGKKAQEVPPYKSGLTTPLLPPPSGLGTRSLSIPTSGSRLPKSKEESMNDTQHGFPSPPLKPLMLPVTTSML